MNVFYSSQCERVNFVGIVSDQPTFTTFTAGTPGNSVIQGTTATLTCSADGYPAPTYTIRHGSNIVTQQSKTGRYVINNIQLNAEKESYVCEPSNKVGDGQNKELMITVQGQCSHLPPCFRVKKIKLQHPIL